MGFDRPQIKRRSLLKSAGFLMFIPVLAHAEEEGNMWGIISKITVVPGGRERLIDVLKESAAHMPGCLSYVVAKDAADETTMWVTEVWDSMASHDASLSLPAVKNALARGKALISGFEKIAVTTPAWGLGLA